MAIEVETGHLKSRMRPARMIAVMRYGRDTTPSKGIQTLMMNYCPHTVLYPNFPPPSARGSAAPEYFIYFNK